MSAIVSRLAFDPAVGEIRDGERRYLLMRPDVLMGCLHALPVEHRATLLDALATSAERNGGRSVRAYADATDAPDNAQALALLATLCDTAAGLGWGRWRIVRHDATGFEIVVRNSPFAQGHGPSTQPVCAPIVGILRSTAPLLFPHPATVLETVCAAHAAHDVSHECRFTCTVDRPLSSASR